MTDWFVGRVALVTGAGSGIGRASAQRFAQEGARVVVSDINEEGGSETVRLIREAGGEALFVRADVAQAREVEALIHTAVERYGRLDCAHNNAGISAMTGPIADATAEEFERVLNVNLKGVWLCMKYEIQQMLKQGKGAIVNTASTAGLIGLPGISAYVASKHGIVGITKVAALEYAQAGIRVNAICPGLIDTPMLGPARDMPEVVEQLLRAQPIGRMGTAQEIASTVAWLCSDEASFITGVPMPVDGGSVAQ